MKKYKCMVCGWVYDEAKGSEKEGLAPGTNDNSKLYGSFFTRKGTTLASLNMPTATVGTYRENDGRRYTRSMLGWHWISDNNTNLIAEISQDDRGMNNQEWQNYKLRGAAGLALVRPNGLRQRYHFLRLGKKFNTHELSLSRRTSTDNSALNTLKWSHDLANNLQLNVSHSQTTGDVDSEYKAYFPDQNKTSLVLRYNFDF